MEKTDPLRVWDIRRDTLVSLTNPPPGGNHRIAISPNGKWLAAGVDREVRLWDIRTGAQVRALGYHAAGITALAFSPDGERLASASTYDAQGNVDREQALKVWDTRTGQELLALPRPGVLHDLAFDAAGQRIAGAMDGGTVQIWDGSPRSKTAGREPSTPPKQ
jgi:WD40 repeat protein